MQSIKLKPLVTAIALAGASFSAANAAEAELASHLSLHLAFENLENILKDTSGYDLELTNSGANSSVERSYTVSSALAGQSFNLTATSTALALATNQNILTSLNTGVATSTHTVGLWVNAEGGGATLVSVKTGSNSGYTLATTNSGELTLTEFGDENAKIHFFDQVLTSNTWHYLGVADVTGLSSDANQSVFLNGVKLFSSRSESRGEITLDLAAGQVQVGGSTAVAVDDVRVYNRQLNLTEVGCLGTNGFNCVLPAGAQNNNDGAAGHSMDILLYQDDQGTRWDGGSNSYVKQIKARFGDAGDLSNIPERTIETSGLGGELGDDGQSILNIYRSDLRNIKFDLGYRQGEARQGEENCNQTQCIENTVELENVIGQQLTELDPDYELSERLNIKNIRLGDEYCEQTGTAYDSENDLKYLCVTYNNSPKKIDGEPEFVKLIDGPIKGDTPKPNECQTYLGDTGASVGFATNGDNILVENGVVNIYRYAIDGKSQEVLTSIPYADLQGETGPQLYPSDQGGGATKDCEGNKVGASGSQISNISSMQIDPTTGKLRMTYSPGAQDLNGDSSNAIDFPLKVDGEPGIGANTNYAQVVKNIQSFPEDIPYPAGFNEEHCRVFVDFDNTCEGTQILYRTSGVSVSATDDKCGASSQDAIMACAK